MPSDPAGTASDADALELAVLEQLVRELPLPSPELPGWQSLTAVEYERAVRELSALLGTIIEAFASARRSG